MTSYKDTAMKQVVIHARTYRCKGCDTRASKKECIDREWIDVIEKDIWGVQFDEYLLCPSCAKHWRGIDNLWEAMITKVPDNNDR